MKTAVQVFYEGRVQGVGFRFMVKSVAKGFEVVGTVRNLEDGRVEVYAHGDKEEVAGFLEGIAESELKSHIRNTERHPVEPRLDVRGFQIAS